MVETAGNLEWGLRFWVRDFTSKPQFRQLENVATAATWRVPGRERVNPTPTFLGCFIRYYGIFINIEVWLQMVPIAQSQGSFVLTYLKAEDIF